MDVTMSVLAFLTVPYIFFIPVVRKAGFSTGWILVSLVPVVGLVLLWAFAFVRWPSCPEK